MKFSIDTLRHYQSELIQEYRATGKRGVSVCLQAPTGTGKTPVIGGLCHYAIASGKTVWVVLPRNRLVKQTSKHLAKWGISHGIIQGRLNGSAAYNVHIVSKDTIMRRIKNRNYAHPDVIIIDEGHVSVMQQLTLKETFPDSLFIGLTATPESADVPMCDMWDKLILSKPIKWFIDAGYLSKIRYYRPDGLDVSQIRGNVGKDYTEKQIDDLISRSKIYGDVVSTYRKHCHNLPAIAFCASVKLSRETAQIFRDAGYVAESIDGTQSDSHIEKIITEFENGNIHVLTNCMIATYGLDLPNAAVGLDIAPTKSRPLYLQKIGRITRPFDKYPFKYWFDFANNLDEHNANGIPLIYHDGDIDWNFDGKKKKNLCDNCKNYYEGSCPKIAYSIDKRNIIKDTRNLPVTRCKDFINDESKLPKKCPVCNVAPFDVKCSVCGYEVETKKREGPVHIDAELTEFNHHLLKSNEIPAEDKRIYNDRINMLKSEYADGNTENAIKEMYKICKARGYNILWVYHQLNPSENKALNVPLLYQIQRVLDRKPGEVYYWKKTLSKGGKR